MVPGVPPCSPDSSVLTALGWCPPTLSHEQRTLVGPSVCTHPTARTGLHPPGQLPLHLPRLCRLRQALLLLSGALGHPWSFPRHHPLWPDLASPALPSRPQVSQKPGASLGKTWQKQTPAPTTGLWLAGCACSAGRWAHLLAPGLSSPPSTCLQISSGDAAQGLGLAPLLGGTLPRCGG